MQTLLENTEVLRTFGVVLAWYEGSNAHTATKHYSLAGQFLAKNTCSSNSSGLVKQRWQGS